MRPKSLYLFVFIFLLIQLCQSYAQLANHVVIAEIYCSGGNSGAVYKYDYIVLYNPESASVNLSGWSIQYATALSSTYTVTNLTGIINSQEYYLIKMYSPPSPEGSDLPIIENDNGTTNLSGTAGKIALVDSQNSISSKNDINVVDFIGYGWNPSEFEGSAKATYPSNASKSLCRKDNNGNNTYGTNGSGWDSNDNSTDFFSNSLPSPLPIILTVFDAIAINNLVVLNWSTQTEINNYGFNIERKIGNSDWLKIGFIQGHGNCNSPKNYTYKDLNPSTGKNFYRLKQIDIDGKINYSNTITIDFVPKEGFILYQNYPNPFNPLTKIKYSISQRINVKINLYDILGREIKILINKIHEAGNYELDFDGRNLSAGIYLYKLQVGNYTQTKKMILME